MTLTADTVGKHDTIGGACSNQVNYLRYGIKNTCSCRDNFIAALKTVGIGPRDIHSNINFFMHVPVAKSGRTGIREGLSRPGDSSSSRRKDVMVVISNCPQFYNPCSGWNPTPIRLIEWRPKYWATSSRWSAQAETGFAEPSRGRGGRDRRTAL